jgi:hypothetical protein
VDGVLMFSKLRLGRHPEDGEVVRHILQHLGL